MVERRRVALGNARFLDELGIATRASKPRPSNCGSEGATAIFVAIDGKAAGVIAIADPVKKARRKRWPRSRPTACASSC